jgi:hypothetical protein
VALLGRLERHEDDAGVRGVDEAVDRKARKRDGVRHSRLLQREIGHLANDGIRAIECRGIGELGERDQIVLVLRRNEALRHSREAEHRQTDEPDIDDERRERHTQHARHRCRIGARGPGKEAIEAAEEPAKHQIGAALQTIALGPMAAQQPRRERRTQRQGIERRDHRGDRNRQGELAVELPGQPADECGRHEDGAEDQRNRNDRAGDFLHRLARRLYRRQPQLDVPLHVLDHDNRIVDDDADGEHQTEERQRVQREAEHEHDRERADERDRHRHKRDDRCAPRLQEHHHDDHDEENRLEQGHDDRPDRLPDEDRRVVDDAVLEAGRERLLQPFHHRVDLRRGLDGVRAGPLRDADGHRRFVVQQAAKRIEVRAELDASDVAKAGDLPLRRRANDDVGELLFRRKAALRVDRELKRRVGRRGRCPEHAGGDLHVLFADGSNHVGRRQLARRQLVGIEPHAHAVFAGAEHLDGADAGNARELVLDLQVREVRQIQHVVAVVGRHEVGHEEKIR